jgi:hypothetical protein
MCKENPTERVNKSERENKHASEEEAAFDDVHNRECIGSSCAMLQRCRNGLP